MALIGGVSLWTAVTGEGPPLMLLHGGPGAPDYLGPLAALLPARVHRHEQRGCGRSEEGPAPVTIRALLDDLDGLRAHWGLERCVVGGHSWGASLALLYALERPARVTRLLYLNGMGIETGWEREHAGNVRARLAEEDVARHAALVRARDAAASEEERDRLSAEAFAIAVKADCPDPAVRAEVRALLRGPFRRRINQALVAEWNAMLPALAPRVSRCEVAALLVQGARDTRPNGPARRLAERLPDARYVELDGAGHFPWMERPEAFLEAVGPWIGGVP